MTESESTPAAQSDPRGLALVVFQKFHRELPRLDENPSDRTLRELIIDAINLLPEFDARKAERRSHIYLKRRSDSTPNVPDSSSDPEERLVNIQATIDCLRTLWSDFRQERERERDAEE